MSQELLEAMAWGIALGFVLSIVVLSLLALVGIA